MNWKKALGIGDNGKLVQSQSHEGGVPALSDPHNLSSDITPSDLVSPDTTPQLSERDAVEYVRGRFEEAQAGRSHLEDVWLESLAFDIGGQWQWHYWDRKAQKFEDLRNQGEIDRYITDNQIRPIILKLSALATTSKPDATVSGLTGRDIDAAAAREGRGIDEHCDDELDGDAQLGEWVDWSLRTTSTWLKCYWHPTKEAMIPVIDAQGNITKVISAPVGDHCEEILSFAESYPEPAKTHSKMRWFVHASVRPISELADHYGQAAYGIEPSADKDSFGYLEARLSFINGDLGGGVEASKRRKTHVLVLELWELPSPRYPKGLFVTVAGDRRLRWGGLPDEYLKELPFIPLEYQKGIGTLYGRNAVQDLMPLQRGINRAWSRIVERMEADKLTVMVPEGAELDPDAFRDPEGGAGDGGMVREKRDLRVVYHRTGFAPSMQQPPPINSEWFALPDKLLLRMQNISGIHDVSMGIAPGSASGVQVGLLQQGDKSQMSKFGQNIETAVKKRTQWRIRHYAQYCKDKLPRLIGLSDSADPQQALAGAKALTALTAGGQVRVKITPGSAIPKFPEAQDGQILEMAKAGMFQPDQLPSTIAVLKALAMEGSNPLAEDLLKVVQWTQQQAQGGQADPAQAEAVKAQAAQQAQAAEQAHEQQQLQMEQQHEQQSAQIDLQKQQALEQQRHMQEMERLAYVHAHPSVALAGKLDPQATIDAERQAGLEGDMQAARQMAMPPKPLPNALPGRLIPGGKP